MLHNTTKYFFFRCKDVQHTISMCINYQDVQDTIKFLLYIPIIVHQCLSCHGWNVCLFDRLPTRRRFIIWSSWSWSTNSTPTPSTSKRSTVGPRIHHLKIFHHKKSVLWWSTVRLCLDGWRPALFHKGWAMDRILITILTSNDHKTNIIRLYLFTKIIFD